MKTIHTTIVQDHLSNRPINKLLNRPPPDIDKKEETLPHSTRRKLSQLRTNKSPLLMTYLHKIDPANHPAANCPLCNDPNHDSLHLFNCSVIPTTLTVWDLWTDPVGVAALLDVWGRSWAGPERGSEILCVLTHGMGSTPPHHHHHHRLVVNHVHSKILWIVLPNSFISRKSYSREEGFMLEMS